MERRKESKQNILKQMSIFRGEAGAGKAAQKDRAFFSCSAFLYMASRGHQRVGGQGSFITAAISL